PLHGDHRDSPSLPTRRSSDLFAVGQGENVARQRAPLYRRARRSGISHGAFGLSPLGQGTATVVQVRGAQAAGTAVHRLRPRQLSRLSCTDGASALSLVRDVACRSGANGGPLPNRSGHRVPARIERARAAFYAPRRLFGTPLSVYRGRTLRLACRSR